MFFLLLIISLNPFFGKAQANDPLKKAVEAYFLKENNHENLRMMYQNAARSKYGLNYLALLIMEDDFSISKYLEAINNVLKKGSYYLVDGQNNANTGLIELEALLEVFESKYDKCNALEYFGSVEKPREIGGIELNTSFVSPSEMYKILVQEFFYYYAVSEKVHVSNVIQFLDGFRRF